MRSADLGRLLRYGVSGVASMLTHFGLALGLAEAGVSPVTASTAGFAASVVVSYALQRNWVFRSSVGHGVGGARFLAVTAVALGVNTAVVWAGTTLLHAPYGYVQALALAVIPLVNYTVNSRWTFRAPAAPTAAVPGTGCTRS